MSDQENRVVVDARASARKKRPAASMDHHPQPLNLNPSKKRIVCDELPSFLYDWPGTESESEDLKCPPKSLVEAVGAATEDSDVKADDPQLCGPYAKDIDSYYRSMEKEAKRRPLSDYMVKVQKDVTATMRGVLVDWLVEVAEEYNLCSETLYLTVSYMDRYLSLNSINRKKLQLLGISSMLIASKYEEINHPKVDDFCYITERNYSADEVVKMEAGILKSLEFELGTPTTKTFLRKFINLGQETFKTPNMQLEFLGNYVSELSLLDYDCVKFLPSLVAASAIFLSRFTIQPQLHPWSSKLQQYSGYKPSDLKECVLILQDLQLSKRRSSLEAVRERYKQHKFKRVARMTCPPEIPSFYFEDMVIHV